MDEADEWDGDFEEKDAPDIVYHYCGPDAFKCIIQNKNIWLTRSDFLNDRLEQTIVPDCLKIHKAKLQAKAKKKGYSQKDFKQILASFEKHHTKPTFITSFSKDKDSVSQWSLYGDKGKGFAIGWRKGCLRNNEIRFITKAMNAKPPTSYGFLNFEKVLYHDKGMDQHKQVLHLLKEILDSSIRFNPKLSKICNKEDDNARLGVSIHALAACFKHNAFAAEQEWRYYYTPGKDTLPGLVDKMNHRTSPDGAIIPYFAINMPKPAQIIVGTLNPMEDDQVYSFLHHNYSDFEAKNISRSNAPLRFL